MRFDLNYRKKRFKKLFPKNKNFTFKELITFHKLPKNIFFQIQEQVLNFILASFEEKTKNKLIKKTARTLKSNKEKLNFIIKNVKKLYSITPNGFIIPKSHSYLEYNILLKSFYKIFNDLGLKNKIKYWQEPIGICIKYYDKSSKESKKKNRFYHQTSNAHIESWAGYSTLGINTLLPVFGNVNKNYTEFFEPKKNFNELEVNRINKNNIEIIKSKNYQSQPINSLIKNHYKCGTLIAWDNIFLHKTKIKDKKSYRIFIVNQFIPVLKKIEKKFNKISKYRKAGILNHKYVCNDDYILKADSINNNKFKSTLGGRRAAYNLTLVK